MYDYKISFSIKIFHQALERNADVPETTFTNFHISEYLESFDSETDYIGLMIASVKYKNEWYHDGRKHDNIRNGFKIRNTIASTDLNIFELHMINSILVKPNLGS